MYGEMVKFKMMPDLSTLNELIRIIPYSDEPDEKKLASLIKTLTEIKHNGLMPNLITFNNALHALARITSSNEVITYALDIFKEMKLIEISKLNSLYIILN
jgi:hypothetical protein